MFLAPHVQAEGAHFLFLVEVYMRTLFLFGPSRDPLSQPLLLRNLKPQSSNFPILRTGYFVADCALITSISWAGTYGSGQRHVPWGERLWAFAEYP